VFPGEIKNGNIERKKEMKIRSNCVEFCLPEEETGMRIAARIYGKNQCVRV
jgi:hypothetical protein